MACRAWLIQQGYRITQTGGDVMVVPTSNPDQLSLFSSKKIDGVWTVEPWVSRLELEAGGRIYLEQKEIPTTLLVASVRALEEKRDLVKKFVAAHEELTGWINTNPDEAKKLANAALKRLTKREMSAELIGHSWPRLTFGTAVNRDALASSVADARSVGFLRGGADLSRLVEEP